MTATDEKYDPARVIQEIRRIICVELMGTLGDNVVPTINKMTHTIHAFFKALPDLHYSPFEAVLLCERPRDGILAFAEDVATGATSYYALRIRGKIRTILKMEQVVTAVL